MKRKKKKDEKEEEEEKEKKDEEDEEGGGWAGLLTHAQRFLACVVAVCFLGTEIDELVLVGGKRRNVCTLQTESLGTPAPPNFPLSSPPFSFVLLSFSRLYIVTFSHHITQQRASQQTHTVGVGCVCLCFRAVVCVLYSKMEIIIHLGKGKQRH